MLFLVVFDKVMLNKSMKYIEIIKYSVMALGVKVCVDISLTGWSNSFFGSLGKRCHRLGRRETTISPRVEMDERFFCRCADSFFFKPKGLRDVSLSGKKCHGSLVSLFWYPLSGCKSILCFLYSHMIYMISCHAIMERTVRGNMWTIIWLKIWGFWHKLENLTKHCNATWCLINMFLHLVCILKWSTLPIF